MNIRNYASAALVLSAYVLSARASDPPALPSAPHIVVVGSGTATAQPDYLELTLQVSKTRQDGLQAKAAVDTTTKAVLTALRALGVKREHVTTSQVTLDVVRDYEHDTPSIVGYEAGRTIEVELRNMTLLDQLVQEVTAAGVTAIWSPRVRSNLEAEMKQQVLTRAVEVARKEADSLATAAGRALGPVYGIATREARSWQGGGSGSVFGDAADDEIEDWLVWVPPPVQITKEVYVVFLLGPASQRVPE